MTEKRLGRVVSEARSGHFVVEWLQAGSPGSQVAGFVLMGPFASTSIIYSNASEALEALQDIEARVLER
jgi:hypothetical protein